MNVCRKAKVIVTKKKEFNSKIRIFLQDFLALLKSLYVKSFIEKKTSWYDMRPLDQKGLNIWVWNCIKELCKESGEVLGLTSNHLKVGPPQTLRASPSWHFPKNASTFTRIDILLRSTSAKPYFVHLGQTIHFCLKWSERIQMGPKGSAEWKVLAPLKVTFTVTSKMQLSSCDTGVHKFNERKSQNCILSLLMAIFIVKN